MHDLVQVIPVHWFKIPTMGRGRGKGGESGECGGCEDSGDGGSEGSGTAVIVPVAVAVAGWRWGAAAVR